ncbi:MAG: hypothetical protein WKG07_44420 [Hymenobacter sp.]
MPAATADYFRKQPYVTDQLDVIQAGPCMLFPDVADFHESAAPRAPCSAQVAARQLRPAAHLPRKARPSALTPANAAHLLSKSLPATSTTTTSPGTGRHDLPERQAAHQLHRAARTTT